jgi:hypothetical protein
MSFIPPPLESLSITDASFLLVMLEEELPELDLEREEVW